MLARRGVSTDTERVYSVIWRLGIGDWVLAGDWRLCAVYPQPITDLPITHYRFTITHYPYKGTTLAR
ncbi:MAG: hypothetical protein QNJ49_04140 [Mastigocoleus sp. MO_167.B18]|nr:hypothetical protein [Mastigocoleus sp. MO_167.B18]